MDRAPTGDTLPPHGRLPYRMPVGLIGLHDRDRMNRKPLRYRVFALFAAGMFLATMAGDAFGAHKCPHHDVLPGTTGSAVSSHAHGAASQQHTGSHAEHEGHGPCTCIGHCNASGTAAVGGTPARVVQAGTIVSVAPRAGYSGIAPANRPAFLLPFATAPPVSAV